jgi:membrane fusion protein, multidrug efflux system
MSRAGNRWRLVHNSAWAILFFILLPIAEQGCKNGSPSSARSSKEGNRGGAIPVAACKTVTKDLPIEILAVGTVQASSTVTVKSQISGELTQVLFREGDFVKRGDALFKIDSRTYEAQLNQAQANLARDEAAQAQIEANLARDLAQQKYAQSEAARYASLFDKHLISKEQTEQSDASAEAALATARADMAAIQSAKASIEATKAAIANARVMLGYTTIRSPLDGRTGALVIKQGNVISPNTDLMTINQVEPVYVAFSVPQNQLSSVKKMQPVTVSMQDNSSTSESGKLFFIDNTVDPTTGTILIKAIFPNKNHMLWPGAFVRVVLRLGTRLNALIVPSQAIQTGQDGPFVFVIKPDQTVESRPVVPGMQVDGNVVVEKGLQVGETVVTEGQLRLMAGSHIQVRDNASK